MTDVSPQLSVRVTFPKSLEEDPTEDLAQVGASDVRVEQAQAGVAPLLAIVVAAVISVNALAELIIRWRDKHRCQQIIDTRGGKVQTKVDCSVKDGRIIVVSSSGEKVEIVDAPKGVDLSQVLSAAISGGADATKKAAQAAGATVSG
jgi:hypothetical protein